MMTRARGPVWHKKQKELNVIPKGLRGIDRDATWGKSAYDGWIYGHGTFCLVTHNIPIVGLFQWMTNSANEAKRMHAEVKEYDTLIRQVCMDSKADDQGIYYDLKQAHGIQLITVSRKGMDKTESRRNMIQEMNTASNRNEYRKRSVTVEPMQGLIADIFDLERCWMRGNRNNRWLFAAMGTAVQMAQLHAYRDKRSTWEIKSEVLGV